MRTVLAAALLSLAAAPLAGGSGAGIGTLAGQAQISYGCPGPMLEGASTCNPWRPFAGARLSVARAGGRARVVTADSAGRFSLRVATGPYTVTPLPQPRTKGGSPVQARVRAGATAHVVVRFAGYPMMVAPA